MQTSSLSIEMQANSSGVLAETCSISPHYRDVWVFYWQYRGNLVRWRSNQLRLRASRNDLWQFGTAGGFRGGMLQWDNRWGTGCASSMHDGLQYGVLCCFSDLNSIFFVLKYQLLSPINTGTYSSPETVVMLWFEQLFYGYLFKTLVFLSFHWTELLNLVKIMFNEVYGCIESNGFEL